MARSTRSLERTGVDAHALEVRGHGGPVDHVVCQRGGAHHAFELRTMLMAPVQPFNERIGIANRQNPAFDVVTQEIAGGTVGSRENRKACGFRLRQHHAKAILESWKNEEVALAIETREV